MLFAIDLCSLFVVFRNQPVCVTFGLLNRYMEVAEKLLVEDPDIGTFLKSGIKSGNLGNVRIRFQKLRHFKSSQSA